MAITFTESPLCNSARISDPVVSVRGMHRWVAARGFTVVDEFCSNAYLDVFGRGRPVAQTLVSWMAGLSRGRLSGTHNNLGFVMEKPTTAIA